MKIKDKTNKFSIDYLCMCISGFLIIDVLWKAEYVTKYQYSKYHKTSTIIFNVRKFFIPKYKKSIEEISDYTRVELNLLGLGILYRSSNEAFSN